MLEHLFHFFAAVPEGYELVQGRYQYSLVFLSVLVAVSLSLLAMLMAEGAQRSINGNYRQLTIATGSVALGSGIWTMHFIGMFAYHLPAPVAYHPLTTFVSMLPALGAAWATLSILTQPKISKQQLLVSGVLMGAGIGTMHYGGMLAIETPLLMRHDMGLFVLSIVVAVLMAMLALGVRFGLQSISMGARTRFWLGGTIMGCAIASMHYTAMASVRFYGDVTTESEGFWVSTSYIALAISSITITIAVTVAAVNGLVRSRELNREIQSGKQRLIAIFDTAVDSIITINPLGIIQEFSRSAEEMFGYKAEEVVGHNIKMLMPDPYHSNHDNYLKRYMDTQEPRIIGTGREVVGRRKDGNTFPMRLAVGRVDLADNEILFVGLITDISDRKALEKSLRQSVDKAEQAAAAKTSFLANMSHEIRTPMNAIIGFTDLVLQTDLNPQQRSHLNTIRQSSRSLLGLLNDILDITKLESGRVELEVNDFSLKAVAAQIESTLRVEAQNKGLQLSTTYPDNMPVFFKGDAFRLIQVLTNLVGNAVKFTERGEVSVVFAYRDEKVHIEVKDTGIGMSKEQIASIFDAFTQADASISRRFGGTGLGTTISRQLVEAMDGHIEVESELGQGSSFHVCLPLEVGKECNTNKEVEEIQLPPLNILIADDIEQNLELLKLVLEGKNHKVTQARNGDEAVTQYIDGKFDVVLMDVHMPRVDGLQATRYIRDYERATGRAATPIIALTASVMASDRKLTEEAGMNGFAVKPLDVPSLFMEIARLLGYAESSTEIKQQPTANTQIDWQRGVALWGDKGKLIRKIRAFVAQEEKTNWDSLRAEELVFKLHSIKGVAGNLGLIALSQWVDQKEKDSLQDKLSLDDRQLTAEFIALLKAIKQDLPNAESLPAHPNENSRSSLEYLHAGQELLTLLANNQLDDNLLAIVLEGLSGQAVAIELQHALDEFDFEKAHSLLERYLGKIKE